jgi:hypothetical protein
MVESGTHITLKGYNMDTLSTIVEITTAIGSLATSLTLIVGFIQIRQSTQNEIRRRKEIEQNEVKRRQEVEQNEIKRRQEEAYDALDEKFIEFQKLCLNYPALDIFDVPDVQLFQEAGLTASSLSTLTEEQQRQKQKEEVIAFTLLFSIFERAYVMYDGVDEKTRKEQWSGWDEYIHSYCRRANFRFAWKISGSTYDIRFQDYMEQAMKEMAN